MSGIGVNMGKLGNLQILIFLRVDFCGMAREMCLFKKKNCSILPPYIKLDRDIQFIALLLMLPCRNKL